MSLPKELEKLRDEAADRLCVINDEGTIRRVGAFQPWFRRGADWLFTHLTESAGELDPQWMKDPILQSLEADAEEVGLDKVPKRHWGDWLTIIGAMLRRVEKQGWSLRTAELAAWKAKAEEAVKLCDFMRGGQWNEVPLLKERIAELERENAEKTAALEKITKYVAHNGDTWPADTAREALGTGEAE